MQRRAQIMRPVEGGVVHQGWLHPALVPAVQALFEERPMVVCAPEALALQAPSSQSGVKVLWSKLSALLGKTGPEAEVVFPGQPLPVQANSQALVWSELWLHHVEDPAFQLQEWLRVLKPGGCVFFSCFGPDTARELLALASAFGLELPDFLDMHDWGDALVAQGFSEPVVEMERLTLTYETPQALLKDWRALLGRNVVSGPRGLFGRKTFDRGLVALEALRQPSTGRIHLSLELVYAHAWKVEKKAKSALGTVRLEDIGGRKAGLPQ